MARRTTIRTGDMITWVNNIKNTLSDDLVLKIVNDLKEEGPYWSGQFEESWVVKEGSVEIPATDPPKPDRSGPKNFTGPSPVKNLPKAKGRKTQNFSIGNTTTYRDIAMDLDPERRRTEPRADGSPKNNTADPDWYLNYMQNKLYSVVPEVVNRTANRTEIKNYRGKL